MKFIWLESARNDLRAVERAMANRILLSLTDYGKFGVGDVKKLTGPWQGGFGFALAITV